MTVTARLIIFSVVAASLVCGAGCTSASDCPASVEALVWYADDDGGAPSCRESCPGGHRALLGCEILAIDMAVRFEHVRCSFGPCPAGNGGIIH